MKEEREQLQDTDPFIVIEYIKSSIEILLSLKLEEQEKELKIKQQKHTGDIATDKITKTLNNFKSNGAGSSIADFFSDQSSCRIDPP